jgi:hypothetical protein
MHNELHDELHQIKRAAKITLVLIGIMLFAKFLGIVL